MTKQQPWRPSPTLDLPLSLYAGEVERIEAPFCSDTSTMQEFARRVLAIGHEVCVGTCWTFFGASHPVEGDPS